MNNLNRIFDPNIRIPAPNPASRIGSVATRNETNKDHQDELDELIKKYSE